MIHHSFFVSDKQNLKVREHKVLGPYVDGLSKLVVSSFQVNCFELVQEMCRFNGVMLL